MAIDFGLSLVKGTDDSAWRLLSCHANREAFETVVANCSDFVY